MNETADSSQPNIKSNADGYLALTILVVTAVVIVVSLFFLWRNKKLLGISDNSWKTNSFTPPPERENYIAAKLKLDPLNPTHLDELKKLLMRRAIQAIPILLNLQNEGNSIERLYKRGMLTDDMHFKVKELKAFVDQEFQDVQVEAEELVEGWGQHIWPQAMQFHQMIQRQNEEKEDEVNKVEEQKKKVALDKKKEKEKAKKQKDTTVVSDTAAVASVAAPVVVENQPPVDSNGVLLEGEALKAYEAERMAKMLLEEEEKERNAKKLGSGSGAKVSGKK